MTDNQHPSYPKPTIREALCELRFPGDASAFGVQFGKFWTLAQQTYSGLEAHVDQLVAIAATGPLLPPQQLQPMTRARFVLHHSLRSMVVQVVAGAITLNVPAPYLGWQTMEQDIQDVWQLTQEAFQPSQVTGITLRYIDAVPQPPHLVGAEGWIVPGDYIPPALFRARPPFSARVQTGQEDGDSTGVGIGYEANSAAPPATMVVDFDRTLNTVMDADVSTIMRRVNDLHEDIWRLFAGVKGPRWDALLQGRTL